MKLGKHPPVHDIRTLRLARYLAPHLRGSAPLFPDSIDLSKSVHQPFPMDANDQIGDCTIATAAHMIQVWSAIAQQETTPTAQLVTSFYYDITHGQDSGANELDVLTHWRNNPDALDPSGTWAPYSFLACDPNDPAHIKAATYLFGGVYIGIQLPSNCFHSIATPDNPNVFWHPIPGPGSEPGSWGGHAVNVVGYDQNFITVVTWGQLQRMTWEFWAAYTDEAYAILPQGWSKNPNFDFAQLEKDLQEVAN